MKLSTIVTITAGVVAAVAGALYLNANKDEVADTSETTVDTEAPEVETESTEAPVEA